MLPSGAEQILSLAWALENIADFTREDAISATCDVIGISKARWESCAKDTGWHIGDGRWGDSREAIESRWNRRFAKTTESWLDENVWHTPLWHLWLPARKMVFAANLSYLLMIRGRGSVADLAKTLGRSRTTASKWGRWRDEGKKVRVPTATAMLQVLEFFGLRPSCDLYTEPLFLGHAEIEDAVLRIEGRHYLDCLSGEHLRQAVTKLQEETARQGTSRLVTKPSPQSITKTRQ